MRIQFDRQGHYPFFIELDPEFEEDEMLFQFSFSEYTFHENLDRYYFVLDEVYEIIVDTDDNTIAVFDLENEYYLFEVATTADLVEKVLHEFESGISQFAEYTDHAIVNNAKNNNFSASLRGLYMNTLPKNAENAIMGNKIEEGNRMVNFHNERNFGRYYKERTYNALPHKKNPYTKKNIRNSNAVRYIAHVKKRKSRKNSYRKK